MFTKSSKGSSIRTPLWYSGANQIRTVFLFSKSGFYVTQRDGLGTILVVEGDDQFVIVKVNPVDEGINQPLSVGLLAHIQNPELVQVEQNLLLR